MKKQNWTASTSYPRGLIQLFSVGPTGPQKVNKSRATFLSCNFASCVFSICLLSNYPHHCPIQYDKCQAPLFFKIRGNLQRKSDYHRAKAREPLELTAVSLVCKGKGLRLLRNKNQIVSKIHLNLLGLSVAI